MLNRLKGDKGVEPLGFPEHDFHQPVAGLVQFQVLLQDLDGAADGSERVSDFVSDPRRQLAYCGEPVILVEALLHGPELGDVVEDDKRA